MLFATYFNLKIVFKKQVSGNMVKQTYFFLLFLKIGENNSYLFLKIILYFTLFLKIVYWEQWSNSVKKF